jgi:AraC-like DNA-binding protein
MNRASADLPFRDIRLEAKQSAGFEPADRSVRGVTRSAREVWAPGFCGRNSHPPDGGLVQVLAGRGWFHDGHRRTDVEAGWIFCWPDGRFRAFGCDGETMSVAIVNLAGPWEALFAGAFNAPIATVMHPQPLAAMDLLDRLHQWALDGEPDGSRMAAALLEAYVLELRNRLAEHGAVDTRRSLWLQSRRLIIRQAEHLPTTDAIADKLGVSVSYLCRLYRTFDTQTPGQLLRRCRMTHAAARIRSGDALADLAGRLGYADQSSFAKAFARVMGQPPGRYRKAALRAQCSSG